MIYASELKPIEKPNYRIREDDTPITLAGIKSYFESYNNENYGLPIRISFDQIKSGGLFNSTLEDCLSIINVQHENDYFKYCLTLRKQGRIAMVAMTYYGQSALTGQKNKQQEREQNGSLGGILMNLFSSVDETQYAAEYDYYDMLEEMFSEMFR